MSPDDTNAPPPLPSVPEATDGGTAWGQVHFLIPAAIQRRMAERVAVLREEIGAFVASLPSKQEGRP